MNAKSAGRKASTHPFAGRYELWAAVEHMIARGDLVLCEGVLIWFHDRADALTQDLAALIEEYRRELTAQVAPKVKRAPGGP